jgi:hypothetical protein
VLNDKIIDEVLTFIELSNYKIYDKNFIWVEEEQCFYCINILDSSSIEDAIGYLFHYVAEDKEESLKKRLQTIYGARRKKLQAEHLPSYEEAKQKRMHDLVEAYELVAANHSRKIPFNLQIILGKDFREKIIQKEHQKIERKYVKEEAGRERVHATTQQEEIAKKAQEEERQKKRLKELEEEEEAVLTEALKRRALESEKKMKHAIRLKQQEDPPKLERVKKGEGSIRREQTPRFWHQKMLLATKYLGISAIIGAISAYLYQKFRK